jgi:hypothetical protein
VTDTARRPYDNTRRREQAAQTRDRIVSAGADLVRREVTGTAARSP